MAFSANDKIGDIVVRLPKAGELFKQQGIDFCCGGNRVFSEVAVEQGIDAQKLLAELNDIYEEMKAADALGVDFAQEPLDKLIDHVVNKHHAYLHTTLPALGELVTKILRVHGAGHGELAEVHRLYHSLKLELEQHLIKEETLVFPLIKEFVYTGSDVALDKAIHAVDELEGEHDRCGEILKQLDKVTGGYKVPDDGCGTYHYTYQKLAEVEEDTFRHIHLENNILFPRLRSSRGH